MFLPQVENRENREKKFKHESSIKLKEPVFWVKDLYAACSFMWSISFICNLSLFGYMLDCQDK